MMTEKELEELRVELTTQNNLATQDPLWVVYGQLRIYGVDSDHRDSSVWLSEDDGDGRSEVTDTDTLKELEKFADDGEAEIDGSKYIRLGYVDVDQFAGAFLTRKAASEFVESNAHHLNRPHVYVESLHRNEQMRAVRAHFMGRS